MNREFLDLFNKELGLLKEQAKEFADEYPGIASRMGNLIEDRSDNMILGLLEGAAFLAARVQLKIKHEFPEFTRNLLEQLVPNYLAPSPSIMMARFIPPYGDPALRDGMPIPRGAYLDSTFRESERNVACRFALTAPVTLWPFDLTEAEYCAPPTKLQSLGLDLGPGVKSGLRLRLTCRSSVNIEDEVDDRVALKQPDKLVAGCRISDLPVYILGDEADAIALYAMLIGNCTGVFVRSVDTFGNTIQPVPRLASEDLVQIGFEDGEELLPTDVRIFRGFDLLREYFLFPRKFIGFKLRGLGRILRSLQAKSFELIFAFDVVNPRMAAFVRPDKLALYASPAVNLFAMDMDRIQVKSNQHEYHVVPDRSRTLDFEPHKILDVHAHFPGGRVKQRVPPLYSTEADGTARGRNLFYSTRRLPRRRTIEEKKYGVTSDYRGTDVFLSLVEPDDIDKDDSVMELSVRALCSNRHLPEHVPVHENAECFQLRDDTNLKIVCVEGPTPPREPVPSQLRSRGETAATGVVTWRLINMLALNHLGLVERGGGGNGQTLKDILAMFADMSDGAMETRIQGIQRVDSQPIVRRIRRADGVGAARGIEITVTMDDRAFEGSGVFLLGAVLDRFFAEYAAINSFTQTVIKTTEWGELIRWPARLGLRGAL